MPTSSPQRAWEARFTLDHPLFGTGLVKLDAGYDRISLLQDRILTDEGFDAPGNIGTGKRAFVALAVDAPLDRFGIKGARLKLNGQLQRTRVDDPISGETRNFTGFFPDWEWSAEFRRDIGKFAYGTTISDRDRFSFFRAERNRHQLQRRALRHRLRRISAQRAHHGDLRRRQSVQHQGHPQPPVQLPQPRQSRPPRSTNFANAIRTSISA